MSTVPLPVRFHLPAEGWRVAGPEETAQAGAAFLALREGVEGPFVPNITLTGELRTDEPTLTQLGDQVLAGLQAIDPDVVLMRSEEGGSPEVPSLTQLVSLQVPLDGEPFPVQQCHVVLVLRDEAGGPASAVYLLALTARPQDLDDALQDFGDFVSTIELAPLSVT